MFSTSDSAATLPRLLIPYDSATFGPGGAAYVADIAANIPVIVVVRDHDQDQNIRAQTCQNIIDVLDTPPAPDIPDATDQLAPTGPRSWCVAGVRRLADLDAPWPPELDGWHLASSMLAQHVPTATSHPIIGASCHNEEELHQATQHRVRYATLSPFFPSLSKPGHTPSLSLSELAALVAQTPTPVFALGGVTPANVGECHNAGAYGVAAVGALADSGTPVLTAKELLGKS